MAELYLISVPHKNLIISFNLAKLMCKRNYYYITTITINYKSTGLVIMNEQGLVIMNEQIISLFNLIKDPLIYDIKKENKNYLSVLHTFYS